MCLALSQVSNKGGCHGQSVYCCLLKLIALNCPNAYLMLNSFLVSSPEELAVVGELPSFPLQLKLVMLHEPLCDTERQPFFSLSLSVSLFFCFFCFLIPGADTRVRVSYQEEALELRLPFGSHSRLFLSEVNRAWSGRSAITDIADMFTEHPTTFSHSLEKSCRVCGNFNRKKRKTFENEWFALKIHDTVNDKTTIHSNRAATQTLTLISCYGSLTISEVHVFRFSFQNKGGVTCVHKVQTIFPNHLFGGKLLGQYSIPLRANYVLNRNSHFILRF